MLLKDGALACSDVAERRGGGGMVVSVLGTAAGSFCRARCASFPTSLVFSSWRSSFVENSSPPPLRAAHLLGWAFSSSRGQRISYFLHVSEALPVVAAAGLFGNVDARVRRCLAFRPMPRSAGSSFSASSFACVVRSTMVTGRCLRDSGHFGDFLMTFFAALRVTRTVGASAFFLRMHVWHFSVPCVLLSSW